MVNVLRTLSDSCLITSTGLKTNVATLPQEVNQTPFSRLNLRSTKFAKVLTFLLLRSVHNFRNYLKAMPGLSLFQKRGRTYSRLVHNYFSRQVAFRASSISTNNWQD